MEKLIYSDLLVSLYIEDSNHKMPRKFLPDEVYTSAIEAFVIVCTDAIVVNRHKQVVYLTRRRIKPMQGWWIIGGKSFAGEIPEESIQRSFKRETSLELSKERFELIAINRHLWKDRQQEPQHIGSDNLAYTFAVELTPEELTVVSRSLDSYEYEAVGLQEFSLNRLKSENVHPMIIDLYRKLFS